MDCEDTSDCPGFSGALFSYQETTVTDDWGYSQEGYHIGLCSQQLIAPNRVLTNRHCLPADITYKGASCRGKIYLKFPKTADYEEEEAHCSKVIDLSPSYNENIAVHLDWAILELESPVKRPFVKQNLEGIADQESVKAFPVYFRSSNVYRDGTDYTVAYGSIKKADCIANMSTTFGVYHNKKSPIFAANRCSQKIISGNSGSGLLNKKNELIGVISFALSEDNKKIEYAKDKKPVYLRQTVAGGTNLHCIDPLNASQSEMCYFEEQSLEGLMALGAGASSFRFFNANFEYLKKDIIEENLSKPYLSYSNVPDALYDVMVFGEAEFASLPKSLVEKSLYGSLDTVFPNFPSCVAPGAPDSFDEKLAFLNSKSFTINNESEILFSEDDVEVSYYLLSYKKELSSYRVDFVRISKALRNEYDQRIKDLAKLQKDCESPYLGAYFCSQYKREKNAFGLWLEESEISPAVLKNEELLEGTSNSFDFSIPSCL